MKKIIPILILLFFTTGCLVGPKYSRPKLDIPTAYLQDSVRTDSITNLKWWEVYRDTVLQTHIRVALEQNKDLLTAAARVEEARAILGFNRANLYPFIDYTARAGAVNIKENAAPSGVGIDGNQFWMLGNVSWEIDLWGKLRHANRSAYAQLLAADEDRKAIIVSLVAQVAELYFTLRGLDEQLEISKKTLQSRSEYLRIITLRFEKGEVAEIDKLQALQLEADAAASIPFFERQIEFTKNALNVLMGRVPGIVGRGLSNQHQVLPPEIPSGLPSELIAQRPDVRFAEQNLIAQTEEIGVAVALRFPSLSLTGFAGLASQDLSNLIDANSFAGSIVGQLTGPIFRFNQNKRRVEAQRAVATQFAYQYEKTVLQAFADVENALSQIKTYKTEYIARSVQVTAAEKTVTLSRALYDNGYTSFLQVLDAERNLFSGQLVQAQTHQNQLIATVQLYKALGRGW
jgi:multidrug efflux system outer membrane protein